MVQPIHFLVSGFKDSLQNTGHEAEELSFVVCDVNSDRERLQVNFSTGEYFFHLNHKNGQNWLYAKISKQRKNGNCSGQAFL